MSKRPAPRDAIIFYSGFFEKNFPLFFCKSTLNAQRCVIFDKVGFGEKLCQEFYGKMSQLMSV
jgi:hypothetical protein